jgi:hypothetical protein
VVVIAILLAREEVVFHIINRRLRDLDLVAFT